MNKYLLFLFAIFWTNSLFAQTTGEEMYREFLTWHDNGNHSYSQQRALLKKAADLGHAPAQNALGVNYYRGTGRPIEGPAKGVDYQKALFWFNKAASQNNATALCNLGIMYLLGNGVQKNPNAAIPYLEKSIDLGDLKAKNILSTCYAIGLGVEKNIKTSIDLLISYYMKRDSDNLRYAEYDYINLSLFFEYYFRTKGDTDIGKEIKSNILSYKNKNFDASFELGCIIGDLSDQHYGIFKYEDRIPFYEEAARNGKGEAYKELAEHYRWNEEYTKAVDYYIAYSNSSILAKIGFSNWSAIRTIAKKANEGNADAECAAGMLDLYLFNNKEEAFSYFSKSASKNFAEGQNWLGICYYYGYGTPKDYSKSTQYFQMAANKGLAKAQYNLGNNYYTGNGTNKDYEKAVSWYMKSVEQNYIPAMNNLGDCLYYGLGIKQDYKKAFDYFKQAEAKGYTAEISLGLCYLDGYAVPKDIDKAIRYFKKCNFIDSLVYLGRAYYNKEEYTKALSYFKQASKNNIKVADGLIGMCYYYGKGVNKNFSEAFGLLKKSVDSGATDPQILHLLSNCYRNGYGVAVNLTKADELLQRAMDKDAALARRINNIQKPPILSSGTIQ